MVFHTDPTSKYYVASRKKEGMTINMKAILFLQTAKYGIKTHGLYIATSKSP